MLGLGEMACRRQKQTDHAGVVAGTASTTSAATGAAKEPKSPKSSAAVASFFTGAGLAVKFPQSPIFASQCLMAQKLSLDSESSTFMKLHDNCTSRLEWQRHWFEKIYTGTASRTNSADPLR